MAEQRDSSGRRVGRGPALFGRQLSRRQFLIVTALAGAAAGLGLSCRPPPPSPPVPPRGRAAGPAHLAWVWKFAVDGPPERIASVLAQNNLGIILKTHTGTEWMAAQDSSRYAVSGPGQVAVLADYFETYGIPFHTYCVVHGLDPLREAEMCADVIAAGARSVIVDLEPYSGYWQGTPQAALAFGQEFRRRQPGGVLYACVEPRPWQLSRVPVDEFASFSQGLAPMEYWESFNTAENVTRFQESGFPPGPDGVTPEFLLDVSDSLFDKYHLPVMPIGQGASPNHDAWVRFVLHTYELGMGPVSVWRYGVTVGDVWPLLRYLAPPGLTPGEGAALRVGGSAVVTNTGACLNVRSLPSPTAAIRTCLDDGTVVKLREGPLQGGGFRWWRIEAGDLAGWVAEGEPGGDPWLVPLS